MGPGELDMKIEGAFVKGKLETGRGREERKKMAKVAGVVSGGEEKAGEREGGKKAYLPRPPLALQIQSLANVAAKLRTSFMLYPPPRLIFLPFFYHPIFSLSSGFHKMSS